MKCSKASVHRKTHRIPELRFEDQRLTSFAGLIVFQSLFSRLGAKKVLTYHNGRGTQEGLFAELKSQTQMD